MLFLNSHPRTRCSNVGVHPVKENTEGPQLSPKTEMPGGTLHLKDRLVLFAEAGLWVRGMN